MPRKGYSLLGLQSKRAKLLGVGVTALIAISGVNLQPAPAEATTTPVAQSSLVTYNKALSELNTLAVKGRAPKTGYARAQFGPEVSGHDYDKNGCVTRDDILKRDLTSIRTGDGCKVTHGTLKDPYTNETIKFIRTGQPGGNSNAVQIDHLIALSDAWQKGAQQWTKAKRTQFMHDPANLLAVKGSANASKGDGDAATWLPPHKSYRCMYVSKQVTVKKKYGVWVTSAEKTAIANLLKGCGAAGTTFSGPFLDVSDNHKFAREINWMHSAGLSTGIKTSGGREYRPGERLSREAMAAFMFRQYGDSSYRAPQTSRFSDVRPGHKFYREISWMYDAGLSTGVRVGTSREYRPSDRLSREAMAAFMYRALGNGAAASSSKFTDVSRSHKFYAEISWMAKTGLSTGVKTSTGAQYRPQERLSREAMAAFMYRARTMPHSARAQSLESLTREAGNVAPDRSGDLEVPLEEQAVAPQVQENSDQDTLEVPRPGANEPETGVTEPEGGFVGDEEDLSSEAPEDEPVLVE